MTTLKCLISASFIREKSQVSYRKGVRIVSQQKANVAKLRKPTKENI